MRICKYVPLSRQRSWEEGWHFWSDHGILYFMTFYLLPDCSQIAKTGKRIKKQQQPLPYSGK